MPKFLKLAIDSVRNPKFGEVVDGQTTSAAVWYFVRYQLILSLVPFILSLFALAYFVPQLPKLARENLPDQTIAVKDNQLQISEKIEVKNNDFSLFIDPQASPEQLNDAKTGLLVNKDSLYIKSENGQNTIPLSVINGVSLSKESTARWLEENKAKIFAIGIGLLLVLSIISAAISILFRIAIIAVWCAAFTALKKSVTFTTAFKYSLFASVIGIAVSMVLQFLSPSLAALAWVADIVLTVYLFFKWQKRSLTASVPPMPTPALNSPVKKTRKKSSR